MLETLLRRFFRYILSVNLLKSKYIAPGTRRERTAFAGLGFSERITVTEEWNGEQWECVTKQHGSTKILSNGTDDTFNSEHKGTDKKR